MANSLNREIKKGEEVVQRKSSMRIEYQALEQRIFVCKGGSGMQPETRGTKVFGYYKTDGEKTYIRGSEIDPKLTAKWQAGEVIEES